MKNTKEHNVPRPLYLSNSSLRPSFCPSPMLPASTLPPYDRELLKMFLWYDLYIFLSKTFNLNHKDNDMFNPKLIRLLLLDITKDGEHTLEGIEYVTRIPLDVLQDIVYEINTNPSTSVASRIIEYYIITRRQEHTEFIRKILQWVEYGAPYRLCEPSV